MSSAAGQSQIPTLHEHERFKDGALVDAVVLRSENAVDVHCHDFLEVAVIGAGTGEHVTARGRRPTGPGDVYVLRPGTWHGYRECRRLVQAYVCVSSAALRGGAAFLHDIPALRDLLWLRPAAADCYGVYATRIPERDASEAVEQIAAMEQELATRSGNLPLVLGRLLTILGTVTTDARDDRTERELHPAVAATLAAIDAAPAHEWSLAELAHEANLDPAYLSRLFRRHIGLPPIAHLARVRAERAAALLAETSDPVSLVGAAVGWPNPTNFARRFRSLLGLTPTEYRRRTRTSSPDPPAAEHGDVKIVR